MRRPIAPLVLALMLASAPTAARADAPAVRFALDRPDVEVFDFAEVVARVDRPPAGNPFRDATFEATFRREGDGGDAEPVRVAGFCDADDGSVFRLRFLPRRAGTYTFTATYRGGGGVEATHEGRLTARDAGRPGPLRVDAEHPWHFVREGDGQHVYLMGTTTYWLLGWTDESIRDAAVDRLAALGVNRVRVALNGRTTGGDRWGEPLVKDSPAFRFRLDPWPAARPDDPANPGLDVSRFNLESWRRAERMLAHARDRRIFVSLIFHLDGRDPGVDPFGKENAGGADEQAYYRYAVARLAAFANVTWDVTNEWHLFRDEAWVDRMGALIKEADPYDHIASVHGDGRFLFRTSPWADFALYQQWDEGGSYDFMIKMRRDQADAGRPMPQINEEYGYEDHYPKGWGGARVYPARSADNRRRMAWGMAMAGAYQTTGERADRGTGANTDSGGGWLTGRGDDTMTMLAGYRHIAEAFTSLEYWKLEPHPELVAGDGALGLAEPGRQYLVYLPRGGAATIRFEPGRYLARRLNCRTGAWDDIEIDGGPGALPAPPDAGDWAVTLVRQEAEK